MTAIATELERQRRIAQSKAWDAAGADLVERVTKTISLESARLNKPLATIDEPNAPDEMIWDHFNAFTDRRGVRFLPAKPQTIAAHLLELSLPQDQMLEVLSVISRRHDKHGLSNPCATAVVRSVLNLMIDDKPPASWSRQEAESWATLPVDVRYAIARREKDRDRALRMAQDKAAESRKKYEAKTKANPTAASDQNRTAAVGV